ncbi:cupin domain-containing protein [Epilithonimonas hispanica]|uniref:hypothetical protein n=1 Tax=Epilithonimonas hispanica TaxID=358687 RepID=UPI001FE80124|nr:hypothetical protein [Epilithonimonas hispanica]
MKNIIKGIFLSLSLLATAQMNAQKKAHKNVNVKVEESENAIPAVRLISNPDGTSSFERGTIPTLKHMNTTTFWINNKTEEWEKNTHKAPRRQYVITLKGKIKFKVSDGSTFIIEPGVILLAEDTTGVGHSWDMVNSKEWERLYVPITENADDLFVADKK